MKWTKKKVRTIGYTLFLLAFLIPIAYNAYHLWELNRTQEFCGRPVILGENKNEKYYSVILELEGMDSDWITISQETYEKIKKDLSIEHCVYKSKLDIYHNRREVRDDYYFHKGLLTTLIAILLTIIVSLGATQLIIHFIEWYHDLREK